MTGKQLIDFIKLNKLERSKIDIVDSESMDFTLKLNDKTHDIELIYYIKELYLGVNEDDELSIHAEVSRMTDEGKWWFDKSLKEAAEIRNKYALPSEYNDGEKIINYIKDNYLYDYLLIVDEVIKNHVFDIKFIKRIVLEDSYNFNINEVSKINRSCVALNEESYDKIDIVSNVLANEIFEEIK